MTEIRKDIKEAIKEYNAGNWKLSIEKLENAKAKASAPEVAEIDTFIGWNKWKMQEKDEAARIWTLVLSVEAATHNITKASAHAGLGIFYAEKGNKEKALRHAKLAQELPLNATVNQAMNLNACLISVAKLGDLKLAEEIWKRVANINEQLEKSDDLAIAKKAKHQRAKNGYNRASLILIPQSRFYEALMELEEEVIPRYIAVEAETDLAAAYHRIAEINEKLVDSGSHNTVKSAALDLAFQAEEKSLALWRKHPDDPKRIETAEKNIQRIYIQRIKEEVKKLKQ